MSLQNTRKLLEWSKTLFSLLSIRAAHYVHAFICCCFFPYNQFHVYILHCPQRKPPRRRGIDTGLSMPVPPLNSPETGRCWHLAGSNGALVTRPFSGLR